MAYTKITEQPSLYDDLEKTSTLELLHNINQEDKNSDDHGCWWLLLTKKLE